MRRINPAAEVSKAFNKAHTQPDGAYHYHGDPKAMYATTGKVASPVIEFAADEFPVFAPYIDENATIRKVKSGLQSRSRIGSSEGNYDYQYREDYEFTEAGELEAYNSMTNSKEVYGYYMTTITLGF